MIIVFRMNNPTEFILCPMIIIFPMLSPSTRRMLLQTKSAGSGSFVVSLQARNQFSNPSTEMELVQWPRVTRLTTCEQDRCVCVILHISSWRYGRIVILFWCTNDDYNLCVCDFAYHAMKIWPHCNLVLMYQWWL
jgi:hypothetical protein